MQPNPSDNWRSVFHVTVQICFNSATMESLTVNCLIKVLLLHLSGVLLSNLTRLIQNLYVSFEPVRGGHYSSVLYHYLSHNLAVLKPDDPTSLENKFHVSLGYGTLPMPWNSKLTPHRHTTTAIHGYMMFLFWNAPSDVTEPLSSKEFPLWLIVHHRFSKMFIRVLHGSTLCKVFLIWR